MALMPAQLPRAVRVRVMLAWLALLSLLSFYWLQLYLSHQGQIRDAEIQARLRASQTAHALSYQVESQFRKLDFVVRHLGEHWIGRDDPDFRRVFALARDSLAQGALIQLAVVDARGQVVFSSLSPPGLRQAPVSLADRQYFRFHLESAQPALFISEPLVGRLSGEWGVQFSRPLLRDGKFVGVIILSVSVEHLAAAFRKVFPEREDVVLLASSDGSYLTRSHGLASALGKKLPGDRDFLLDANQQSGNYEALAAVDGIARYYAWQRIPGYPVILSLGLGKDKVLAPIQTALRQSHIQNVVGSLLLLLAGLWITGLELLKALQNQSLLETREHLRQAVEAVRDGLWSWDVRSGQMHWDSRCHEMLGHAHATLPTRYVDWCALLHANDREMVDSRLQQHVAGWLDEVIAIECRLLGPDASYRWVELRGRMVCCADGGDGERFIGTCSDIGARVAESQLRRALLDQSTAAILLITPQRRIIQASARAHQLFAAPGQSLVGVDARQLHLSEGHFTALVGQYELLQRDGEVRVEYPLRDVTGLVRWFDMHAILCEQDNPQSDIVWTMTDISERHAAEQALEMQSLRLTTLLERFPAGVLLEDADCRIVMANLSSCRLLGLTLAPAALAGMTHRQLLASLTPQCAAWLPLPGSGTEKRRMMEVADERGRTLEIDWVPIVRAEESLGHVWLLRDISERKQKERELAVLASTDSLTGLPNRRSFMAQLNERTSGLALPPLGALLMIDIDHFKRVNDTYGHPVGDRVLQHVAQIIRHCLRKEDQAGRLGGEEFAVLLTHATPADARQLAERLRETIARTPALTDAGQVSLTVSIGLVELDGQDGRRALNLADQALYAAKAGGRNRVCQAGAPEAEVV